MTNPSLKKELGLTRVVLMGIGIILGAGIYALVGKAAGVSGNTVWLAFTVSAIVAGFTGLSYAELSSMISSDGAEYDYAKKAFGKKIAFVVGWLIIFAGIIAPSTVALGFGGYLNSLTGIDTILGAFLILLASSFIVFKGIGESANIASAMTIVEAIGLLIIIFIGIPFIGTVNLLELKFGWSGILSGAALIFFAYIGFQDIVRLSEETKNPTKIIPQALLLSIIITTILYILVAISAVSIAGAEFLANSSSPLSDVAQSVLGPEAGTILAIIALFSTGNTVLLMILGASRILYGIANETSLPNVLSKVHKKNRTPWVAILTVLIVSSLFLLSDGIAFIAKATDFALFIAFIVINGTVIKLRFSYPKIKRPFKIPLNIGKIPIIPILGVISCIALIIGIEQNILILGTIILIAGTIVAWIFE